MGNMDWIDQWMAHLDMVMELYFPQNGGKLLSNCATGSF
jgi:hypothetical protein